MARRPTLPFRETTNDEVLQEILRLTPLVSFLTFEHTATGSTADTITLRWTGNDAILESDNGGPPLAALVVRVVDTTDPSGNPGNFRPGLNFDYRDGQVLLYEPEGLTADTKYKLTVMCVG